LTSSIKHDKKSLFIPIRIKGIINKKTEVKENNNISIHDQRVSGSIIRLEKTPKPRGNFCETKRLVQKAKSTVENLLH
jgi:hypothetical protein